MHTELLISMKQYGKKVKLILRFYAKTQVENYITALAEVVSNFLLIIFLYDLSVESVSPKLNNVVVKRISGICAKCIT